MDYFKYRRFVGSYLMKTVLPFLLEILLVPSMGLSIFVCFGYILGGELPGWAGFLIFVGSMTAVCAIYKILDIRGKIFGK